MNYRFYRVGQTFAYEATQILQVNKKARGEPIHTKQLVAGGSDAGAWLGFFRLAVAMCQCKRHCQVRQICRQLARTC